MLTKQDKKYLHDSFASKSDLVSFKDAILKEIRDLRDEIALVLGYRDTIENHDKRLDRIDKHLKFPPIAD